MIVDLAGARLVPAGIVGNLQVGNPLEVALNGRRQIAFHDLHVIDVVLQEQIRGTDVGHDVQRLGRAVDEEPGNVARVDRFEEQPDARIVEARRGAAQVCNQRVAGPADLDAGRRQSPRGN